MSGRPNNPITPSTITDEDIVNDPVLLTINAANREVLEPFDGLVADVVGGDQFVTSPNYPKIFEVPLDDNREVILRADGRYGADDPFLWPQLYHANTYHLACVQAKVKDPTDPAFVLWWTPKPQDLVVEDRGVASGVGLISLEKRSELFVQVEEVYKYYKEQENNQLLYGSQDTNREWVSIMVAELHQAFHRLSTLSAGFDDAKIMVADVQRRCLELRAYIVYMTDIRPKMRAALPIVNPVREFVGVITYQHSIVVECAYAGIPVWYIRPLTSFARTVCIKRHLRAARASQTLELTPMFTPPAYIFKGASSDPAKYHAITRHHRIYFTYRKRPTPNANALATSSNAKRTKVTNVVPDYAAEKFLNRKASCFPPAIPLWVAGLNQVVKRRPLPEEYQFGDNGYAFPDPWSFFPADQVDLRLITYFNTWLRYKPALILRSISTVKGIRLKAAEWRDLLFSPVLVASSNPSSSSSSQPQSRNAQKLSKIDRMLKSWALQYGTIIADDGKPAIWNDVPLSSTTLPDDDTWMQIVYELNELNFRWELQALDAEMNTRPTTMSEEEFEQIHHPMRMVKISECFPGWRDDVSGGDVTTVDHRRANIGLADPDDKRRERWVSALSRLLSTWKGAPYMFKRDKDCSKLSQKEYNDLQIELARFYCQCFFDRYHRAPTIPRYLRSASPSSS